jgi:hypothetical protein
MKRIPAAVILFILLGCIGAAGCIWIEPIAGDWVVSGTEITVVFHNNGTGMMTITGTAGTIHIALEWKKVGERTYTISGSDHDVNFISGTYILSEDGKFLHGSLTGAASFEKKA